MVEGREQAHDTFRGHFGNLAPVAIIPSSGEPMAACPGRDHPLHEGDRVAVLGTMEELGRLGIDTARPDGGPTRSVGLVRRIRLQVGIALEEGNRALAVVAGALLALIVPRHDRAARRLPPTGSGARHLGLLSSLYFTVETVATVGLRGLQLRPPEPVVARLRQSCSSSPAWRWCRRRSPSSPTSS